MKIKLEIQLWDVSIIENQFSGNPNNLLSMLTLAGLAWKENFNWISQKNARGNNRSSYSEAGADSDKQFYEVYNYSDGVAD